MIKEKIMTRIKDLQYKRYQTSVEMLEIRKEIENEKNTPEWPHILKELNSRGVGGYFIRYAPSAINPVTQK